LAGGFIAAIVIGVIVFFLSVPLDLSLRFEADEKFRFLFRLKWLFGLVKTGSGKRKKEPRRKAKKKGGRDWSFLWGLVRTRGLPGKLLRFLRDILRKIKIRDLEVDLEAGLGDPADTALFVGWIWLPAFLLGAQTTYLIRVAPLFHDDLIVQGHAYISIRLIPIQLVPAFIRFGFSQAGIRVLRVLIFRRWNRKKQ